MATEVTKDEAIARVVASATRFGVELNEDEAAEWVAAMETEASGGELVVNVETGVYGHRVTMLDFGPADLARFREMSKIVGFEDRPPQVLTALSISGSAAQSKINAFPADCDFFERIHIKADTREAACAILADLIREKALDTASGPSHRLWEVKFGSHPVTATKGGVPVGARSPMSWTLEEIRAGQMEVTLEDGSPRVYTWDEASREPGWCKLDWVIADRTRRQLANASNVLDPTWEAPDGDDRAARRLPRPVLPGGLPRGRVDPAVLAARQGAVGRLGRRLRRRARARGLEVHGQGAELRQGRAADVQRLPDERALPRGGLHPRAVRRAGDRAVPGRGADPDARRCGVVGRHLRHRDDGRPGRRPDHVGDPGTRRADRGRDGRPAAEPPELAPGARITRRSGPTR